jgi:LuxR family transcriptional regulator, maltose regulon positive regulatory protein
MVSNILKIKANIPPLGKNILSRPRIMKQLEENLTTAEGFTRPLTIVSAPAGYGKTTLVRNWLASRENHTAWYSLDEEDNDRERFWIYVISALQALESSLGNATLEMLHSNPLSSEAHIGTQILLTPLLNDLFSLGKPVILVLDDYHLINQHQIHKDMIFFVENLPPEVHLAVTTRCDPPWPRVKWLAKGKLVEIRLKELRFSEAEVGRLFSEFKGIELTETQLNILCNKTEGWITGLQLWALSLGKDGNIDKNIQSFAGTNRHVLHFLAEEVFATQPEPIRNYLLETSVLNRFCAPLCNAVTDRTDSAEIIAALERNNMFIYPLDSDGVWYRYHHLFSDLLLLNLKSKYPEKFSKLHERAADWFQEEKEYTEAVRHGLACGNLEKVAQILHSHYDGILEEGSPGQLITNSLEMLPLDLLRKYPRLAACKAFLLLARRGREEVTDYLNLALELRYDNEKEQEEYMGMLEAIKAYYNLYAHNFPEALASAEKALKLLPPRFSFWRLGAGTFSGDVRLFSGNPKEAYYYYLEVHQNNEMFGNRYYSLSTGIKLSINLYYLGRLKESEELATKMLQFAREEGLSRLNKVGALWTILGQLLREKGNLTDAERCIERGLLLSASEQLYLGWNYLFKVALCFSQLAYDDAMNSIRQIEILDVEAKLPTFITFAASTWEARILVKLGDLAKARDLLTKVGIMENCPIQGGQEKGYLVLARILAAESSDGAAKASKLLECIEELATVGQHKTLLMETLLFRTCLEEKAGRLKAAEHYLQSAFEIGKQSGFFQVFLDEGRELAPILLRIIDSMTGEGFRACKEDTLIYAKDIFQKLAPDKASAYTTKISGRKIEDAEQSIYDNLVEELSRRELEILNLISQGLSNQDICERLFLSMGTVKWHTSNIYGKLGVRGRTQAVALARKLRLLS